MNDDQIISAFEWQSWLRYRLFAISLWNGEFPNGISVTGINVVLNCIISNRDSPEENYPKHKLIILKFMSFEYVMRKKR